MSFKLRNYQSEALSAIETAWSEGVNRPAVVLPTGAGKTVLFSGLIAASLDRLTKDGKRVLVIAHREELLEQAADKIKAMIPGAWVTVYKGSRGARDVAFAQVVVASVQTLARPKRRAAVDNVGMVIVDECHRYASKTYREVLDHYGCMAEDGTPTVGFTATMTRMDGGLPDVWQAVAYQKRIHWMIKEGYLIAPTAKTIQVDGLNLSTTRITGGDLNSKDVANALEDAEAFTAIAETWCAEASDRQTIVFMPDVRTCELMARAFERVCGATAEVISGNTPSTERKAAYARFNARETRILVSCMVLTEGFDAPLTSCVIIGRPTLNPGLYIQMVGRGLRLHPGKTDCVILDLAGASLKHNLAGVNDLESDCTAKCDCGCLSCGCGDRCKCGIRKCGCRCIEQHETGAKDCKCAGSAECGCGCTGDLDGTGLDGCQCELNPDCACRGGAPDVEQKEVAVEVLKTLTEVDILGEAMAKSTYTWLHTDAGIPFLPVGNDTNVFLLPAPDGGFFQGLVNGGGRHAEVKRLDDAATDGETARQRLEEYASQTGFTFNNRRASWRRTPASERQIQMLRGMGRDAVAGMRKGEASDLLAVAKASRALDARFGKYVTAAA